jgi:hypothetical protein
MPSRLDERGRNVGCQHRRGVRGGLEPREQQWVVVSADSTRLGRPAGHPPGGACTVGDTLIRPPVRVRDGGDRGPGSCGEVLDALDERTVDVGVGQGSEPIVPSRMESDLVALAHDLGNVRGSHAGIRGVPAESGEEPDGQLVAGFGTEGLDRERECVDRRGPPGGFGGEPRQRSPLERFDRHAAIASGLEPLPPEGPGAIESLPAEEEGRRYAVPSECRRRRSRMVRHVVVERHGGREPLTRPSRARALEELGGGHDIEATRHPLHLSLEPVRRHPRHELARGIAGRVPDSVVDERYPDLQAGPANERQQRPGGGAAEAAPQSVTHARANH